MLSRKKILAISLIILVTFIISILYIYINYNNYNIMEKNMKEKNLVQTTIDKCEKFCNLVGEGYGKVVYSLSYGDYICLCKHKDFININNTTYIITRLLDYGVVKNVTK